MSVLPSADSPPLTFLSGFAFQNCVGRTPLGEVWQATTTAGHPRLVTLFRDVDALQPHAEGTLLDRLRALRHDGLAPTEYVLSNNRQLTAVRLPGETTLVARYRECQQAGGAGIPRAELLSGLRTAARTLDDGQRTYGLQHLALMPHHLLLESGRLFVAEYGVAELLWVAEGRPPAEINPRYGARELFEGRVSPRCDQYSLALMYQELLTGHHPFGNLSGRRAVQARLRNEPDLALLPAPDRPAVRRALHPDPQHRFAASAEFISALEEASARRMVVPATLPPVLDAPEPKTPVLTPFIPGAPAPLLRELMQAASRDLEVRVFRGVRFLLHPGRSLHHHCFARMLPGTALLRLDGFRQQWQAELVRREPHDFVFRVNTPGTFWQRCRGQLPGLEVQISLSPPAAEAAATEINLTLRPAGCKAEQGLHLLHELAPLVLESLRQYLQALPDRRRHERLPFEQTARVSPVFGAVALGTPLLSQTLDITHHGMGLYLSCQPGSTRVAIELPCTHDQIATLPARVVRAERCGDGRFKVGVLFQ